MKAIITILLVGLFLVTAPANANITWSGSGGSGTDPFGQSWTVNSIGWGIPGNGEGLISWAGPSGITEIHLTFTGDTIANSRIFGTTAMANYDEPSHDFEVWDKTYIGTDTVWFTAPAGVQLDHGEQFFTDVVFAGDTPTNVNFDATDVVPTTPVPAPGSLGLFAAGLLGLGAVRRKRRRSPRDAAD